MELNQLNKLVFDYISKECQNIRRAVTNNSCDVAQQATEMAYRTFSSKRGPQDVWNGKVKPHCIQTGAGSPRNKCLYVSFLCPLLSYPSRVGFRSKSRLPYLLNTEQELHQLYREGWWQKEKYR